MLRSAVERRLAQEVEELIACAEFQALDAGVAPRDAYDEFVARVVRAHLLSPQIVAFLYALAPPARAAELLHNLLEELGIEEPDGVSHPALLRQLAAGAGLSGRLLELERRAADDLKRTITDPLLYGSLRDVGLAALAEVVAFEYMLSRVASRVARFLGAHRGLDPGSLRWFTHHAEADLAHAEQGLDALVEYVRHYELPEDDAWTLVDLTLRENVFIKRYFGELAAGRHRGMV